MKPLNCAKNSGVALVTTVIVIAVLAVVAVAFMQSTSVDRLSSRTVANYYKAQLAADSGVENAMALLVQTTKSKDEDPLFHGPYATVFARDSADGAAPYLLFARRDFDGSSISTRRLPLFSTTFPWAEHFDDFAAPLIDRSARTLSDVVNGAETTRNISRESDLVCDINAPHSARPNGLVGLSSNGARTPLPVNWIYYNDKNGSIVGRYAYWVDDESSKIDLRFAGGGENGEPVQRGGGTNLAEVSFGSLAERGLSNGQLANLRSYKTLNLPVDGKSLVRFSLGGSGIPENDLWEQVAPYLTTASLHDRRAPDGKLKLNLNRLVQAAPTNTGRVKQELDAIVLAINDNLPSFGSRAASDANTAERDFYVLKIAANIRDFVDSDNIPTMVARDGTVLSFPGIAPGDFIPLGTDLIVEDIPAIGKERGPYLSEYLRVVRVISESAVEGEPNMFDLQVVFGHYVELHNPTGDTINAADFPGGYVLLANREPWENGAVNGAPQVLRPSDVVMRLPANFTIPPNGYAVLTTDDDVIPQVSGIVYTLTRGGGPGQWEALDPGGTDPPLPGTPERYEIRTTTGTLSGANRGARFNFFVRSNSGTPYQDASERLIVGADGGIIDAAPKIYTAVRNYLGRGLDNPVYIWTFPSDPQTSNRNTAANNANSPRFNRGDLRANMEISAFGNSAAGSWRPPGTGGPVFNSNFPNAAEASLSLGARNYRYDRQDAPTGDDWWRMGWKEYTADPAGNHFVANRPLRSVGELGFIYDPARHLLSGFRAHGATLRMGQSDGGANNRADNNPGENFRNWLGGRGTDDPSQPEYMRNAFLLTDVFTVNDWDQGRVNANSLLRDDGVVFRALFDGFTFESSPQENASSALAGKTIDPTTFLPAMVENAVSSGGLLTVGEISRANVFNAGTELASGVNMGSQAVSDAGREEFFRRTAELLTTHSLAFTIYSIGQSGSFQGDVFQPSSTAIKEVTVQLQPKYPEPDDEFERVGPIDWRVVRLRQLSQ